MRWRMLALMTGSQVGGAIVQQGLGSLAPVLLVTFALSKTQLGTVFTALAIGSAPFTTLAGVIVDRYGERVVTLWGGVLLGATLLAASAVASYPWLVACIFLFGISYAAQTPAGGRAVRSPRTMLFTLACMVLVSGQTIMNAFFAITAVADVHVSATLAAAAFTFAQMCAVAGRVVWGKLSDTLFRGDRALPIAAIGAILAACAWTIAHIAPGAVPELFIVGGLLGFSASSWNGVMATAMAEIGGPEYAGSVLGVALTFIFAAAGAAPLLFGSLADARTLGTAWTALAIAAAIGILPALGAAYLARRDAAPVG